MRIEGSTGIVGVIGHPIAHSLSPPMQNAAIQALGLNLCYVAFHVRPGDVGAALHGVRALGLLGLNVTIPHKEAVLPFLDEISGEASRVGAVNTIHHVDGRLVGHNTDVYGILTSLRETAGLDPLPSVVAVLGASGAARGVVYGLSTRPEVRTIRIFNRTVDKASALAVEMSRWTTGSVEAHPLTETALRAGLADAGLLINATSVGMYPHIEESPLGPGHGLHPGLTVYDIVFNPPETRLLRQARAAGARAIGGIEMLVYQGARALEIWTGAAAPTEVMKAAVGAP